MTELTRVPGTTYFADRSRQPDNENIPGVLVVRCESSLLYFNAEFVRDRVAAMVRKREDALRLVVLFLGAVPKVDLAGAELISDLHRTFRARGVDFRLADAHGEVRDALQRIHFDREYGPLEQSESVDAVIGRWMAASAIAPARG